MRSEALTSRSAFNPNPGIDGQVVDVLTFEQAYKGRTSVSKRHPVALKSVLGFATAICWLGLRIVCDNT